MALNVSNTYNVETDNTFFQYIFKKGKKPSERSQKNLLLPPFRTLTTGLGLVLDHDNDPKHTTKPTKKWLRKEHIKAMETSVQQKSVEEAKALICQAAAKKPKGFREFL